MGGGSGARRDFLRRPLVDGSQGRFVQTAGTLVFGSLLLRMSIALAGFYFVGGGHWNRLLLCLLGFVMARLAVTWLTRPSTENQTSQAQEASHAP